MYQIKQLQDLETAKRVGEFLTSRDAFDQTWAPNEKEMVRQAVIESLSNPPHHRYWYIEDNGKIIAAIGIRENSLKSGGYEMKEDFFAVDKKYRRKGIATMLLKQTEGFVKENNGRYIHVVSCDIDSYKPARSFYEKHGYVQTGFIPDYYVEGEGRIDYFKKII